MAEQTSGDSESLVGSALDKQAATVTVLGKKRWMLGVGILIGLLGAFFSVLALVVKPAV